MQLCGDGGGGVTSKMKGSEMGAKSHVRANQKTIVCLWKRAYSASNTTKSRKKHTVQQIMQVCWCEMQAWTSPFHSVGVRIAHCQPVKGWTMSTPHCTNPMDDGNLLLIQIH